MQLNERQRLILAGVLKDHRGLINMPTSRDVGLSGDRLGRRRLVVRDAQAGYIPMNLSAWVGHAPSNSECVLYCREYARLEGMGLVERHNLRGGRRTSHLKLTSAGRWVAENLLAEEAPIDTGEPLDLADLDMSSLVLPEETDATTAP
jgi:hypothetical protein